MPSSGASTHLSWENMSMGRHMHGKKQFPQLQVWPLLTSGQQWTNQTRAQWSRTERKCCSLQVKAVSNSVKLGDYECVFPLWLDFVVSHTFFQINLERKSPSITVNLTNLLYSCPHRSETCERKIGFRRPNGCYAELNCLTPKGQENII